MSDLIERIDTHGHCGGEGCIACDLLKESRDEIGQLTEQNEMMRNLLDTMPVDDMPVSKWIDNWLHWRKSVTTKSSERKPEYISVSNDHEPTCDLVKHDTGGLPVYGRYCTCKNSLPDKNKITEKKE